MISIDTRVSKNALALTLPTFSGTGTYSTSSNYLYKNIIVFTSGTQTFTLSRATADVSILLVGGGGGGGGDVGGGGGAGGVVYQTGVTLPAGTYTTTIGTGGAGSAATAAGASNSVDGTNGSPTFITYNGSDLVIKGVTYRALGGGGGGNYNVSNATVGHNGGSGGGGSSNNNIGSVSSGGSALQTNTDLNIAGGWGGASGVRVTGYTGGGGGGAGGSGTGKNGGPGVLINIGGTSGIYAAGGGGGVIGDGSVSGGAGGSGIGGYGNYTPTNGSGSVINATQHSGLPGTGSGGGGGSYNYSTNGIGNSGGAGASGSIIIAYSTGTMVGAISAITPAVSTPTPTTTTDGYNVYAFTNSVSNAITGSGVFYVMAVGGGGAGGSDQAGGGGGGGVVQTVVELDTPDTISVSIGAGGVCSSGTPAISNNGGNTTVTFATNTGYNITAYGGGGGGGNAASAAAGNGGSGGGGGYYGGSTYFYGTGTSGQGYSGAPGNTGGGGGAGQAGFISPVGNNGAGILESGTAGSLTAGGGGAGGSGMSIFPWMSGISFSTYKNYLWGGGGGAGGTGSGNAVNGMGGNGGSGGGGGGSANSYTGGGGGGSALNSGSSGSQGLGNAGGAAGANTGGGGGGSSGNSGTLGGAGGSGMVLIAYKQQTVAIGFAGTATGYTSTVTTSAGYNVYVYTSSVNNAITFTGTGIVYILAVGGGGSGGNTVKTSGGGGGGGGGVVQASQSVIGGDTMSINVGAGGAGVITGTGNNGSNTTVTFTTNTQNNIVAYGGGGGGSSTAPSSGGSGGGACSLYTSTSGLYINGGLGTLGQGNYGGSVSSTVDSTQAYGGGGGGAGEYGVGGYALSNVNKTASGGKGIQCYLPGIANSTYGNYYWAGGGGGGNFGFNNLTNTVSYGSVGNGGLGGGGGGSSGAYSGWSCGSGGGSALNTGSNGTYLPNTSPNAGANTGGGGGGGAGNGYDPNIKFDPSLISGLTLWFDAADPYNNGNQPSNGSSINTWYDKSGKGNNAVNSLPSVPAYYSSDYNGMYNYPAIYFPPTTVNFAFGTNPNTTSPSFRGSVTTYTGTQLTFFIVSCGYLPSGSMAPRLLSLGVTGTADFNSIASMTYMYYTNQHAFQRNGQITRTYCDAANSTLNNKVFLSEGWFDGASQASVLFCGSATSIASRAETNAFNIQNFSIGYGLTNDVTSPYCGFISEILVYNTALTLSQRQQIEGYMSWKWGLQENLPVGHPYYYSAPALSGAITGYYTNANYFSPATIGGCLLWLDASGASNYILNGTTVSQWNDKSGNQNHMTIASGTPSVGYNVINNRSAISFGTTNPQGLTWSLWKSYWPNYYTNNSNTFPNQPMPVGTSNTWTDPVNSGTFAGCRTAQTGVSSDLTSINTGTNNSILDSNTVTYNDVTQPHHFSIQWFGYLYTQSYAGNWNWTWSTDDSSILWVGATALSGYTTSNNLGSGVNISLAAYTYYPFRLWFGEYEGFFYASYTAHRPDGGTFTNGAGYYFATNSGAGAGGAGTNAAGYFQNTAITFPNPPYSIFVVAKNTSTGQLSRFLSGISDAHLMMRAETNNTISIYNGSGGAWNASVYTTATYLVPVLIEQINSGNSVGGMSLFINGTQSGSSVSGTATGFAGLYIGNWSGYIAEVIIYNSVLSTSQQQLVEGYLAWKWGLQTNLPSTHPYYSSAAISGGTTPAAITYTTPLNNISKDAYYTCQGAYACCLLNSNYNGPVMQLRLPLDINGNYLTDFYADSNGNLNTKYNNAGYTITGWIDSLSDNLQPDPEQQAYAYVTKWYDQSVTTTNHATQYNFNSQPIFDISNNVLNFGYSGVGGGYVANYNLNAYFNLPNGALPYGDSSYTYVLKHWNTKPKINWATFVGGGSNSTNTGFALEYGQNTGSSLYDTEWYTTQSSNVGTVSPNNVISSTYASGVSGAMYVNGTQTTWSVTGRQQANTGNMIGGWSAGGNGYCNSQMYYLYIFGSSLGSSDRAILEATVVPTKNDVINNYTIPTAVSNNGLPTFYYPFWNNTKNYAVNTGVGVNDATVSNVVISNAVSYNYLVTGSLNNSGASNSPAGVTVTGTYTTSTQGSYTFLYITADSTVKFTNSTSASVLLVGGGGAGGGGDGTYHNDGSGGGGGGGVGVGSLTFASGTNYAFTVGSGGARAVDTNSSTLASSGGNTSIVGGTINEVAYGGGYGMNVQSSGGSPGSGGCGGGGWNLAGGLATKGSGTLTYYGNAGGAGGGWTGSRGEGAGGGGAGAAGHGASNDLAGGDGYTWSVTGLTYAGGGGGGSSNISASAPGGSGGGGSGAGATATGLPATSATYYGGGGGGGGSQVSHYGGNGANGIIIIRYTTPVMEYANNYMKLTNITIPSAGLTVAFWVYCTSISNVWFFDLYNSNTSRVALYYNNGVFTDYPFNSSFTFTITANLWYHIVYTVVPSGSNSIVKLYINGGMTQGVANYTNTAAVSYPNFTTTSNYIGYALNSNVYSQRLYGYMNNYYLFPRGLSSSEAVALFMQSVDSYNSDPINTCVMNTISSSAYNSCQGAYACMLLNSNYYGPVMQLRSSADSTGSFACNFYSDILGNLTTGPNGNGNTVRQWLANGPSSVIQINYFSYTGADQSVTVPTGATCMVVQAWGASGATPGAGSTAANVGNSGGGGYTFAQINISAGSTLNVIVGQGGTMGQSGATSTATYGGGGTASGNGSVNWGEASGGGRSAVQVLSSGSYVEIVTAGGGGAAGQARSTTVPANVCYGGGGGGLTGGQYLGTYLEGGGGGTQSAGGVAAANAAGVSTAGTQYTGGNGWCGGGGGGWYGGGGGGVKSDYGYWVAGGGGGGSSYVNSSYVTSGTTSVLLQATTSVAGNDYLPSNVQGTIGNGVVANPVLNATGSAGQNGYVIISFYSSTSSTSISQNYAYVNKWYDQSNITTNHATQTTLASQPVYDVANKVVNFGYSGAGGGYVGTYNSNAFMNLPNSTLPYNDSSYTYVTKLWNVMANGTNAGVISGGSNGSKNMTIIIINNLYGISNAWYGGAVLSSASFVQNSTISATYNGSSRDIIINGTITSGSASGRAQSNTPNYLGQFSEGSTVLGINGQMYYMYIFSTVLSTIDRNNLESTIATASGAAPTATGTYTQVPNGIYTLYVFTNGGTLQVSGGSTCYILAIGGGGSGGCDQSGGGGAGGFVESTVVLTGTDTLTVSIGAGGASTNDGNCGIGGQGGNTTVNFTTSSSNNITAYGGGYGASYRNAGSNGGSGGGATMSYSPGTGVSGQGNSGGPLTYGGGGGAGAAATNSNGGAGKQTTLVGIAGSTYASYYWAGGGGGGCGAYGNGGIGGGGGGSGNSGNGTGGGSALNAGGNGGTNPGGSGWGANGGANTGGGGGGSVQGCATPGGTGGSGIVIIAVKSGGGGTSNPLVKGITYNAPAATTTAAVATTSTTTSGAGGSGIVIVAFKPTTAITSTYASISVNSTNFYISAYTTTTLTLTWATNATFSYISVAPVTGVGSGNSGGTIGTYVTQGTSATSYVATGLTSNNYYYFSIIPYNTVNAGSLPVSSYNGLYTAGIVTSTTAGTITATSIVYSASGFYTTFNWINNVNSVTGSVSGSINGGSFTNTLLVANTAYTYNITPVNGAGILGAVVTTSSTRTLASISVSASNFYISACTTTSVTLTWATNATFSYVSVAPVTGVTSGNSGGTIGTYATQGTTATSYTLSSLSSNTYYYLSIIPYNTAGAAATAVSSNNGLYTYSIVNSTTAGTITTTSIVYSASGAYTSFSWKNNVNNATGTVSTANGGSFTDSGLSVNTAYTYNITPVNASSVSGTVVTTSSTVTLASISVSASNFYISASTATSVTLTWATNATFSYVSIAPVTGVTSGNSGGTIGTYATQGTTATSYTLSSLSNNTYYYFSIIPYNTAGAAATAVSSNNGLYTLATITTATGVGSATSVVGTVTGSFTSFGWKNNVNATSATVTATNSGTFTDTSVSIGSVYTYDITPYNAGSVAGAIFTTSSISTSNDVAGTSIYNNTTYKVRTFTTTGSNYTFDYYNADNNTIYVLAVGGGGGAGGQGGGGGGGVVMQAITLPAGATTLSINVGKGGRGEPPNMTNGDNTTVNFSQKPSSNIIAYGGGAGSGTDRVWSTPNSGGSGGGGSSSTSTDYVNGASGNTSNSNYANAGGNPTWNPGGSQGGGGGGAGGAGINAYLGSGVYSSNGGNNADGGIGIQANSTIQPIANFNPSGTSYGTYYWAGGGGGCGNGAAGRSQGKGGLGGGGGVYFGGGSALNPGSGGDGNLVNGAYGGANTGGGGGTKGWQGGGGAAGGSGIVIIAYAETPLSGPVSVLTTGNVSTTWGTTTTDTSAQYIWYDTYGTNDTTSYYAHYYKSFIATSVYTGNFYGAFDNTGIVYFNGTNIGSFDAQWGTAGKNLKFTTIVGTNQIDIYGANQGGPGMMICTFFDNNNIVVARSDSSWTFSFSMATASKSANSTATITTKSSFTMFVYTANGTFTPSVSGNIGVLIVGGGGGGGFNAAGGGGGGGVVYFDPLKNPMSVTAGTAYTVTVGVGGYGGWNGGNGQYGTNGGNSSFNGYNAIGGGAGGGPGGLSGGNGGGCNATSGQGTSTQTSYAAATYSTGYSGGVGSGGTHQDAGGGGGAGGTGLNAPSGGTTSGDGGPGYLCSMTGNYYGGGGGAGYYPSQSALSKGGIGGGGGGGGSGAGFPGTPNTGGGGGGGPNTNVQGGYGDGTFTNRGGGYPGGSGIVIIVCNSTA